MNDEIYYNINTNELSEQNEKDEDGVILLYDKEIFYDIISEERKNIMFHEFLYSFPYEEYGIPSEIIEKYKRTLLYPLLMDITLFIRLHRKFYYNNSNYRLYSYGFNEYIGLAKNIIGPYIYDENGLPQYNILNFFEQSLINENKINDKDDKIEIYQKIKQKCNYMYKRIYDKIYNDVRNYIIDTIIPEIKQYKSIEKFIEYNHVFDTNEHYYYTYKFVEISLNRFIIENKYKLNKILINKYNNFKEENKNQDLYFNNVLEGFNEEEEGLKLICDYNFHLNIDNNIPKQFIENDINDLYMFIILYENEEQLDIDYTICISRKELINIITNIDYIYEDKVEDQYITYVDIYNNLVDLNDIYIVLHEKTKYKIFYIYNKMITICEDEKLCSISQKFSLDNLETKN